MQTISTTPRLPDRFQDTELISIQRFADSFYLEKIPEKPPRNRKDVPLWVKKIASFTHFYRNILGVSHYSTVCRIKSLSLDIQRLSDLYPFLEPRFRRLVPTTYGSHYIAFNYFLKEMRKDFPNMNRMHLV